MSTYPVADAAADWRYRIVPLRVRPDDQPE